MSPVGLPPSARCVDDGGLWLIGLMSGTSMDGVDGVLVRWEGPAGQPARRLTVHAHTHRPMPPALQAALARLQASGPDELHAAALAANALARLQAEVVESLRVQAALPAQAVAAIGSHGQTVRHQPGLHDGTGYTLQLNQPALLAELTGIGVASGFRDRDVAAGGQGAPLVPAFHAQVFATGHRRAVLNLGGIANFSLLPAHDDPHTPVTGFDCGPGNVLLDLWIQRHRGQAHDEDGRWGAGGQVRPALLQALLDEPFLALPPPKSTGRDLFHGPWLQARLTLAGLGDAAAQRQAAQDVQATLAEFTAQTAADALIRAWAPPHGAASGGDVLVCGGGAYNGDLMARLARRLPGIPVASTATQGLPPLQVEAAAFAWLAGALWHGLPGNRPEVTGARGLRVLGQWTPA